MKGSAVRPKLINIGNVDRMKLLKALWEQRPPALFYWINSGATIPEWDDNKARKALEHGYIDYFCGRRIRADLTQTIIDTSEYDDDEGPTFEDAWLKTRQ